MTVTHQGGGWILHSPPAAEVNTPEDRNDFQLQMAETVRDFVHREVIPALPAMEAHDFSHNVRLLRQAGQLGLTGLEIPEPFGGLGLDKVTAVVVLEALGESGSFSVTFGAHTGIGTLPIAFFGNQAQKEKYLPGLAAAEKIGAYCLTEAGSGSDALGARTTARLSPDGRHYLLNGTKQWITNAGFADVFIVYAKVDGDKFSAFIVEKDFPGVSTGKEEHKLGIRGSSTRTVILEDAMVPVENLLYEVGKGHHIAFNILNIGRFKLGAGTVGTAKQVAALATRYAQERKQFGKALAEFPLIQQKLAGMATRIYAAESVSHRIAALLDAGLSQIDHNAENAGQQSARAIQEYVVECSIIKVLGSEVLDHVVDEGVQIHGGYGFMEEYEVCRAYRDSRINRIFEGTNEINRLLITGDLLKRAMKGQLPLIPALMQLPAELAAFTPPLTDPGTPLTDPGTPLAEEKWLVTAARKLALLVAGAGVQKYQAAVEREQEFLAGIADLLIDLFAMESAVLRAEKHASAARQDLAVVFAHEAFDRIETTVRTLLASLYTGSALQTQLALVQKLTGRTPVDRIALRRSIAQRMLGAGGYTV